jgi:nitroreductase
MDVLDAIRLRRSVKPERLRPDPVDRGRIEALLEAANWAPSHGLTEPWRFVVFTGEGRRALHEVMVATLEPDGAPAVAADDPRRRKLEEKNLNAPVIVAIVCQPDPSPRIVEHEEVASTAIAVHNMHLLARSMGLGAFWSSGAKAFDPRVARFLELEAPARCLGFLYVGWPAGPWPEGRRRPVAEKVRWREA